MTRPTSVTVPSAFEASPTATMRVREERTASQAVQVERCAVLPELDPADGRAAILGNGEPRCDVGVVVEAGHDDLVARTEVAAQRAADAKRDRGHVRPERDLVGIVGTQEVGAGGVDLVEERIGLLARR